MELVLKIVNTSLFIYMSLKVFILICSAQTILIYSIMVFCLALFLLPLYTFIESIFCFLRKMRYLEGCKACYPKGMFIKSNSPYVNILTKSRVTLINEQGKNKCLD